MPGESLYKVWFDHPKTLAEDITHHCRRNTFKENMSVINTRQYNVMYGPTFKTMKDLSGLMNLVKSHEVYIS